MLEFKNTGEGAGGGLGGGMIGGIPKDISSESLRHHDCGQGEILLQEDRRLVRRGH